jgi:hypothetical protein
VVNFGATQLTLFLSIAAIVIPIALGTVQRISQSSDQQPQHHNKMDSSGDPTKMLLGVDRQDSSSNGTPVVFQSSGHSREPSRGSTNYDDNEDDDNGQVGMCLNLFEPLQSTSSIYFSCVARFTSAACPSTGDCVGLRSSPLVLAPTHPPTVAS